MKKNIVKKNIPEGGIFYTDFTTSLPNFFKIEDAETVLKEGEKFPEIHSGDIFRYGDYEYRFNKAFTDLEKGEWTSFNVEGWGVKVIDTEKEKYGPILSKINGFPVCSLGGTFSNCFNMIKSPEIPDTVVDSFGIFYNCKSLKKITNFSKETLALDFACANCINIENVPDIPKHTLTIKYIFKNCEKLNAVNAIPKNVTDMTGAFYGCKKIEVAPSVKNNKNLRRMNNAFENCTNLKNFDGFPKNIKFKKYVFKNCPHIKENDN